MCGPAVSFCTGPCRLCSWSWSAAPLTPPLMSLFAGGCPEHRLGDWPHLWPPPTRCQCQHSPGVTARCVSSYGQGPLGAAPPCREPWTRWLSRPGAGVSSPCSSVCGLGSGAAGVPQGSHFVLCNSKRVSEEGTCNPGPSFFTFSLIPAVFRRVPGHL